MKKLFTITFFFAFTISFSQNNGIFSRLQAIQNNDITFYNIDGYNITSEHLNRKFNEKGLKKAYRTYGIKKKEHKIRDEQLSYNNRYVTKHEKLTDELVQNNSYYFIENHGLVTVITFSAINKINKDFERIVVTHILERTIPKENFNSIRLDTINFAGRKIKLGTGCNWMTINNVQCPYYGQMNWSVHKGLEDAKITLKQRYDLTASKKSGKVILEQDVPIVFEGNDTKAKKVIYDFTGLTSVLASMSGGKTLTIYYVATEVRGNYVSCVLSFWNNDTISENGLAPLLEEVMLLKN